MRGVPAWHQPHSVQHPSTVLALRANPPSPTGGEGRALSGRTEGGARDRCCFHSVQLHYSAENIPPLTATPIRKNPAVARRVRVQSDAAD
ncbi:MAG: hypothetical protein E5Y77_05920 [Mesorhizobium sp.]|nr:MAG: hypothetical protein E5Y77_05920 [Mesorhizobium sp.]